MLNTKDIPAATPRGKRRAGAWFVAALAGALLSASPARAGYLAVVGPAPIRFQNERRPFVDPRTFAPEPRPPSMAAGTTNTTTAPPTNQLVMIALVTNRADTITVRSPNAGAEPDSTNSLVSLPPLPVEPSNTEVITPQLLMPFFLQGRPGSHDSETAVVAPVTFAPPRPSGFKPSSKVEVKSE